MEKEELLDHLNSRITDLENLKERDWLTENGKGQLLAFKTIQQKLLENNETKPPQILAEAILEKEEFRELCIDTKNKLKKIVSEGQLG